MKRLSRADILTMFGYKAGTKLYNLLYSSCNNFCCIVKSCLGISSSGSSSLVLNQQGDWIAPITFKGRVQITPNTSTTTVLNTAVSDTNIILLTYEVNGISLFTVNLATRNPGVSFTLRHSSTTSNNAWINYIII
jgi:hypothetical protein